MRQFNIAPLDKEAMEACRLRIDNLTKPIYSLAQLEVMAERIAGILETPQPANLKYGVFVVGADHLVDGPQNFQHGSESFPIIERFNAGTTATQGAGFKLNATVHVVDAGLESDTSHLEYIEQAKIRNGSHFFGVAPTLSEEATARAIELGFAYADKMHEEGVQAVALGNVGERSLLDALVVTATITGDTYESVLAETDCGPTVAQRATHIHSFVDPFDVSTDNIEHLLHVAGGIDISVLTGFVLGAASHRMVVVFDNAITGAAVLAAQAVNPLVREYVFPSAVYDELIHQAQCRYLGVKPYLHYGLNIDEGLGATMGLSLIDASMHMLNDMKTFVEADVHAAENGPGNERQVNKN